MTLQPPFLRSGRRIIDEESREHLVRSHDFEKLRVITELHMIVWRRRYRRYQFEPVSLKGLNHRLRGLASKALENRSLIQRYHAKSAGSIFLADHNCKC